MNPKIGQQSLNLSSSNLRNQGQFYATLRRYTERLKQERDISLVYLSRINELQAQLRVKDSQIDRLNRLNKQLVDKLSLYTSVIQRSQPKRSMRMSMLLGKNGLTQSIIQTKQQPHQLYDQLKPFEQFFIIQSADSQQQNKKLRFRLNFQTSSNQEHTFILDMFLNNSSINWQPEPFGVNNSQKKSQYVMYLSNSPHTIQSNKQRSFQIVQLLNPSYYYFITCMIHKQLVTINGRYCWIPIIYGFVSLLPFPDTYFRILQQITIQIKNKNELENNKLIQSLKQLMKCPVQMSIQSKYLFMNKIHYWVIPDIQNIDNHVLIFSLGIIQRFTLQLIIDVLILFLLEIPITLISQDQLLLNQFMFYFLYVIKPLKYPYPIVFNVTQKLQDLLASPFPTFTGCTDSRIVQPYLYQRAVFDLDKKIAKSWPILEHLDSSRQFLMRVANRAGHYSRLNIGISIDSYNLIGKILVKHKFIKIIFINYDLIFFNYLFYLYIYFITVSCFYALTNNFFANLYILKFQNNRFILNNILSQLITTQGMFARIGNKLRQIRNGLRQDRILSLWQSKKYDKMASLLKNQQNYRSFRINDFSFVFFLITEKDNAAISTLLDAIKYKEQVLNDQNNPMTITPICYAFLEGENQIVDTFQKHGGNLNKPNSSLQNALHLAAIYKQKQIFKKGVILNIDFNAKDEFGNTPFHYAARTGSPEMTSVMIAAKAKKLQNNYYQYPIHMAIQSGSLQTFQLLKSDALGIYPKYNPIHSAARSGNLKMIQNILKVKPGNLNIKDQKGLTALHHAVMIQDIQAIRYLLNQAGILINQVDQYGNTPLHLAFMNANLQISRMLLQKGGNLDICNIDNLSPADYGITGKNKQLHSLLLSWRQKSKKVEEWANSKY